MEISSKGPFVLVRSVNVDRGTDALYEFHFYVSTLRSSPLNPSPHVRSA